MNNHEKDRNIQNPPYGEEITSICMIVKTSNNTNVGVVLLLHRITKNHEEMTNIHTGCRRPIGCLIFIGHIPQKSLTISGSFAERDLQTQAIFASSPRCGSVSCRIQKYSSRRNT